MIITGNCLEVMPTLAANSVDAIVTDPPYGLSFMGKEWDHSVPGEPFWREALRVAKPGAYLVAFGGTRTYHRLACAIEDAGFELRDTLMWVYGSGFPKSHNGEWGGTALKPAWEPIILARKPLQGTVAANVLKFGTGGLNIDGCRIEGVKPQVTQGVNSNPSSFAVAKERQLSGDPTEGRWPANVLHDGSEEVVALFPSEAGAAAPASVPTQSGAYKSGSMAGAFNGMGDRAASFHSDSGSAARFFYCAKASREDRDAGIEQMPLREAGVKNESGRGFSERNPNGPVMRSNHHPTVKPTDLMRWLCRLVTPPGGTVLDPFCGSGSTGRAASAEGMEFIGIELDPEFAAIAEARVRAQQPGFAF